MRLISLNTWGGRIFEPLVQFIKREAPVTDIFCFQEIYFENIFRDNASGIRTDLAEQIKNILPGFLMVERLASDVAHADDMEPNSAARIGEAIFVKKPMEVIESGGFHTFNPDRESLNEKIESTTGNFQFVKIQHGGEDYLVGNIHGIWFPGSKFDTVKRIEQSRNLKDWIKEYSGKKVLCGDFNLQPATESISMIDSDMRDLIKEFKIKSTRSHYYANMEKYADYIADYIFVSRDIKVNDFKVITDEVSDHLPLLLDF